MTLLVLDASAAVEIALWTPDGARLAAHVATAETLVAPDHFHLECASALRRMELHHEIDTDEAQTALGQILALRVRRVDTAPLLDEAWGLRRNITVADGLYVVLARRLAVALVTGDIRLTRAPRLGIPVLTAAAPSAVPDPSETGEQSPQAPGSAPAEQAENPDADEQEIHPSVYVYFRSQWWRTLPEGAVAIFGALSEGPLTRTELNEPLHLGTSDGQGLNSSAWDPLHQYTDDELAQQRASFADTSFAATEDEPETAAEVMAEEDELGRERVAETDRYAAALGVAPVRTLGELVDLMVAAQVLLVDEDGRYAINPAAPLPAEVLPLSAEEVATQDQLRWEDLHQPTAQAVIRLFDPDTQSRDRLRTSLQKLARQVDAEVESVRAAVVTLLDDGDFTASLDVTTIHEHQVFGLAVDWERFASTRTGIRHAAPADPTQAADVEDPGAP